MAQLRLSGRPIVIWILAVLVAFLLEISEAPAQTTMKRSAGTMSRGDDQRRASGVATPMRGRQVTLSSERRSRLEASGLDAKLGKQDPGRTDSSRANGASDDDEEEVLQDYGVRTLGKSCMYGARGEVIFRPAGAVCRGEFVPPLPSAPDPGPGAPSAKAAPARPMPLDAGAPGRRQGAVRPKANRLRYRPPPQPRAQTRRPPRPTSGGVSEDCIIAPDGRVLYTPAGMTCPR